MKFNLFFLSIILYSSFAFANQKILSGEKVVIGNGTANSYVVFNSENLPISIGIALSKEALEGLPMMDQAYELNLPADVELPPYKHILINWNAMGHEPAGVYDIPHFDFHFYGISSSDRKLISCQGDDAALCLKAPEVGTVPMYYAPTPVGVPEMGWHWVDTRSPEFHGQRFTSTFIYGYYNSQLIFVEPMITREFLLAQNTVDLELSVPSKYSFKGYYPTRFCVNYNATADQILITLKNLIKAE